MYVFFLGAPGSSPAWKPRWSVALPRGMHENSWGDGLDGVLLVRHMRLTLAYHPVTDVRFGATTQLQGTTLEVSEAALRQYLLEDRRLERVDLAIVHPGEACRFGVVFDIVEPRAKEPGAGPDFPGILDAIAMVGQGITHVLQGQRSPSWTRQRLSPAARWLR